MLVRDNKYIPEEDKDFFILLRIGLWQRVEEPLSASPDWDYIFKLSVEQTVTGIITDGIGIYRKFTEDPSNLSNPSNTSNLSNPSNRFNPLNIIQEQNDKFLSVSALIVNRNIAINQLQARVCKLLEEQNITYCVLKGQGVAQHYPHPNLRCPGDIDLLLDDVNYEKAVRLLQQIDTNSKPTIGKRKHQSFTIDGIDVDVFANEFSNRPPAFLSEYKRLTVLLFKEKQFTSFNCGQIKIYAPSATFHCLYLFLHLHKHYTDEGLGLRQVVDWYLFMKSNLSRIDFDSIKESLPKMDRVKQWQKFKEFATISFGEEFNIPTISEYSITEKAFSTIWKNCKLSGNFGHNGISYNDNFIKRSIKRVYITFKRARINYDEQGLNVIPIAYRSILRLIAMLPAKLKIK